MLWRVAQVGGVGAQRGNAGALPLRRCMLTLRRQPRFSSQVRVQPCRVLQVAVMDTDGRA